MSTTTITKTPGQVVIDWQNVAAGASVIGSVIDVSTKLGAMIIAHMVRRTGTGFTAGWPNLRIEGSAKSSGNDSWGPLAQFQATQGGNIVATTLNGAIIAGATSCVVTANTNIAAGDLLFLGHTTLPANYEVVRVLSVVSTTVTFEEACTNAHDTGAEVKDQSEIWVAQLDLTAVARLRAVYDNAGSGQNTAARVLLVTGDNLTTVN